MTNRANLLNAKGRVIRAYEATDITPKQNDGFKADGFSYACGCGVAETLVNCGTSAAFFRTVARGKHKYDCPELVNNDDRRGTWRQLEQAMADGKPLVVKLRLDGIDRRLPLPPLVELEDMIQQKTGSKRYHLMTANNIGELTEITQYVRALRDEYRIRGNLKKKPGIFILHKSMLRPIAEMLVTQEENSVRAMLQDIMNVRAPTVIGGKLRHYPSLAYLFRLHMQAEDNLPQLGDVTEVPSKKPSSVTWRQTWASEPVAIQTEKILEVALAGSRAVKGPFPWDFVRFSFTINDTGLAQKLSVSEENGNVFGILTAIDEIALRETVGRHLGENGTGRVLDIPIVIRDVERQMDLSLKDRTISRPWKSNYRHILG